MKKKEPSHTVGRNVNWYSHYGKKVWRFLKKLKIELLYDPAIPFLGIYPEKILTWKDTCTPMFIAILFTVAKTWKKPKYPSGDEWIKKMGVYIHNGILLSHKREWNNAMCSNMDTTRGYHICEVSQRKINIYNLYVEPKKWCKWTYLQNKQTHRHRKQIYGYQRGKREER